MKISLILFIINILSLSVFSENRQKIMYVSDNDMYVNIRKSNDIKSAIIDTVYNLQIVSVLEKTSNGWYKTPHGYIHQSRLMDMPEYMQEISDKDINSGGAYYFIASKSCPGIVISFHSQSKMEIIPYVAYQAYHYNENEHTKKEYHIIITPADGHTVTYYKSNGGTKIISESTVIAPIKNIIITHNHIKLYEYTYEYCYGLNNDDEICQYTQFHSPPNPLSKSAFENTITTARKIFKILDGVNDSNFRNKEDSIIKISGKVNNFDFLSNLENIFLSGNKEVRKYYHKILYYYPLDGEGTHSIEWYFKTYFGYRYKGEIKVEDMEDMSKYNDV